MSDFAAATLVGASFDGADLEDASFVGADLREASLTYGKNASRGEPQFSYVEEQMARSWSSINQVQVAMPDFSCADLRDADFSGHALFGVARNQLLDSYKFVNFWPSFEGANVANANMKSISIYVALPEVDDQNLRRVFPVLGGTGHGGGNLPVESRYSVRARPTGLF